MKAGIRLAADVELFVLEDEGVFFAEDRQELYVFNTAATFVWCCLEEGGGPAEVGSAYAAAFAVDPVDAEAHVLGLLREWEGLGYIAGFDAPGGPDADLTVALAWLLTNPRLRADFARSPAEVARRLRVRPADAEAFARLDAAALDAQAGEVARASRRRDGPAQATRVSLAAVTASGRGLFDVAAEARGRSAGAVPITRHYRLVTTQFRLCL